MAPKPIERQNVSISLKVFCDETVAALKSNKQLENVNDTVTFLSKFVKFLKIVNVKGRGEDSRLRDLDRGVISSVDDERLSYLLELADMFEEMKTEKQGKREKQQLKDTAPSFAHTFRGFRGMVALTKHLLCTTHEYVCLGHFTSDPIEKMFSKLRQGSGGTYFISVQRILQKVTMRKTKLCLDLGVDIEGMKGACGNSCEKCGYLMNADETFNVFHNLSSLEDNLAKEVKMALVYIAGYVTRNDHADDTKYYVEEFGEYTEELNRVGLTMPGDVNVILTCYFTISRNQFA